MLDPEDVTEPANSVVFCTRIQWLFSETQFYRRGMMIAVAHALLYSAAILALLLRR